MKHILWTIFMLVFFASCEGILGGIYDQPDSPPQTPTCDTTETGGIRGQIYIDASSWDSWYYIDFGNVKDSLFAKAYRIPTKLTEGAEQTKYGIYTYWYDVLNVGLSNNEFRSFEPADRQPEPDEWHIAVHRNNVRTNGGEVLETQYMSLDDLPESFREFESQVFTPDSWNEKDVWVESTFMLSGLIGNQGIEVNPVLSRWLTVSLPPIPPAFELNNHVFIVRFPDGTYAAVQLENYLSVKNVKCHLTINYLLLAKS